VKNVCLVVVVGLVVAGCTRQGMMGDTCFRKVEPLGHAQQVVCVTTDSRASFRARVEMFEKQGSEWVLVGGKMPAVVGRNGLSREKREGDGKSPEGVFDLGPFFGSREKPEGVKFPYRQTTDNDFWVDDPNSPLYNTWQTGPANGRWNSAETLKRKDHLYDYVVVINYNMSPPLAGRGSAIFMHVWNGPDEGRSGCVALAEDDLLKIMRWLDPGKKPVIVIEPETRGF